MKKQEYEEVSRATVEVSPDSKEVVMPSNPLNIGRFMILPKRNVYCIAMKGPFRQSMPLKMIEIAEKANAALLSGVFSLDDSNPEIVNVLAFVDFTNSSMKPEEMTAQFRHMGLLKHTRIFGPTPSGFVYDNFFYPLKVGNERAIIFRKLSYDALFSGIRKEFGSAGEVFLYYMGIENGSKLFEDYKQIGGSADPRTVAEIASAFGFNMGWGVFKLQELNFKKKTVKIRVYDNFECSAGKGVGKPYSHFLRGIVAGLFLHCFKTVGTVEETKCIAQGDPFCEFLVRPTEHLAKVLHSHI